MAFLWTSARGLVFRRQMIIWRVCYTEIRSHLLLNLCNLVIVGTQDKTRSVQLSVLFSRSFYQNFPYSEKWRMFEINYFQTQISNVCLLWHTTCGKCYRMCQMNWIGIWLYFFAANINKTFKDVRKLGSVTCFTHSGSNILRLLSNSWMIAVSNYFL